MKTKIILPSRFVNETVGEDGGKYVDDTENDGGNVRRPAPGWGEDGDGVEHDGVDARQLLEDHHHDAHQDGPSILP